jgi:hypothetical protein
VRITRASRSPPKSPNRCEAGAQGSGRSSRPEWCRRTRGGGHGRRPGRPGRRELGRLRDRVGPAHPGSGGFPKGGRAGAPGARRASKLAGPRPIATMDHLRDPVAPALPPVDRKCRPEGAVCDRSALADADVGAGAGARWRRFGPGAGRRSTAPSPRQRPAASSVARATALRPTIARPPRQVNPGRRLQCSPLTARTRVPRFPLFPKLNS